ncbi:unnamed protein product [Fusarium venenatum]|uniref:Uncharacterized protein n=1 Tax=Fusarium venenatum TaxID=56646 RepID=A0A2L2TVD0_9HYPO|nr:uncharacterized protein FVRRES_02012 [Fusarium venenatum]CEI65500.1 unnamed protein product [Fusarium venenatum]
MFNHYVGQGPKLSRDHNNGPKQQWANSDGHHDKKRGGRQSSKAQSQEQESANEDLLDEELSDKAMEELGESDSSRLKSPAPSQENDASSFLPTGAFGCGF